MFTKRFIHLFKRQNYTERFSVFWFIPQMAMIARAGPVQSSPWVSYMGIMCPSTWTIRCCFPRPFQFQFCCSMRSLPEELRRAASKCLDCFYPGLNACSKAADQITSIFTATQLFSLSSLFLFTEGKL